MTYPNWFQGLGINTSKIVNKHPGTTPIPEYVHNPEAAIPSQSPKENPIGEAVRHASVKVKDLKGFPRIGAILEDDLYFKKDRQWAFNVPIIAELVAEAELLVKVLADPGVGSGWKVSRAKELCGTTPSTAGWRS